MKDHLGHPITRAQMRNTLHNVAENAGLEKRINLLALTKARERRREKTSILAQHFLEYLEDDHFRERYPEAFDRWESALDLVERYMAKDADTIGNHCRRALEFFADGLCARHGVAVPAKSSTKEKIRAVVAKGKATSRGTAAVLEAITDYTGALDKYLTAVGPYSQRQTHVAKREKESITLEDGRRLVFQTMMVMYEIDRGMDQLLPQPTKRPRRNAA